MNIVCRRLLRLLRTVLSYCCDKILTAVTYSRPPPPPKIVNSNSRHIKVWQPVTKNDKNSWANVRLQCNWQPKTKWELLITEQETRSITSINMFRRDCLIAGWKNFQSGKYFHVDELASVWWMTFLLYKVFAVQVDVLALYR
jgi:hypothetical protein